MKRKFSRILGVGLAIALVVSLGLIPAVPVSANESAMTVVVEIDPAGDICVCENFIVRATITNTGAADLTNVTARLEPTWAPLEEATWVGGGDPDLPHLQTRGDLTTGDPIWVVEWEMHCTSPEDVTFTVTGFSTETDDVVSETADAQQVRAELLAVITLPLGTETITECQDFNLVFTVENTGNTGATGVTVNINPGPNAQISGNPAGLPVVIALGPLTASDGEPGGDDITDPQVVAMHCTGAGPTTITVTPAGLDDCTLEPIPVKNLEAASVEITQEGAAELTIEVTVPFEEYLVCENFVATVTVENIGDEDAEGVVATVTVNGTQVEIEGGGTTDTVDFGDIAGNDAESLTVDLHCAGAGLASVIEAEITAGTAANTGDDLTDPVVSGQVTVDQYDPAEMTVAVVTDKPTYNVGEAIEITVTLANPATPPAAETVNTATPSLVISGGTGTASAPTGPTPASVNLGPGESQAFTYMSECTGVGTVIFTADGTGTSSIASTAMDPAAVTVTPTQVLPELVVTITEPEEGETKVVCQNFQVFATVKNNSVSAQTGVEADLVLGANVELVSGDDPQDLGGLAPDESKIASWWVHCTGADPTEVPATVITVNATSIQLPSPPATATVTVNQQNPTHPCLSASVDGPEKAYVSQTFSIHAEITNDCQETAIDVSATLETSAVGDTGTAALVAEELATKILGDIPPGETYMVEWTVHCTGAGEITTFTVTPAGYDDITGLAIPDSAITPGSDTVKQVVREGIQVVIDLPAPLTKWGPACGPHDIDFTVTNTGYSDLTDVTVTLVIAGNALIEGGDTADLVQTKEGDLDQGNSWLGTFEIECTGEDTPPAYTTFTLTASGYDEICKDEVVHDAVVEVYQKYIIVDAYLQTPQDEFCVGNDIVVEFEFTNCYTEDLDNVQAEITIDGPAHLFVGDPLMDLDPVDSEETVVEEEAWHVECDGPGLVTITVRVLGMFGVLTLDNTDTITFNQVTGPVLGATIDTDACDWVVPCTTYNVTGIITNSGDGTAKDVKPTLTFVITGEAVGEGDDPPTETLFPLKYGNVYPGSETIYLDEVAQVVTTDYTIDNTLGEITFVNAPGEGEVITADYKTTDPIDGAAITSDNPDWTEDLAANDGSLPAAWTVHCLGPTDPLVEEDCAVVMSIEVTGTGVCPEDPTEVTASSDTITVSQFPLAVTVTATPEEDILTGETFSVDAVIKNVGGGDDCPCEIENVVATISFLDTNAGLAGGESFAKTIGTVPWNIEQSGVEGMKAQWTVKCLRHFPATIKVTVSTTYQGCELSVTDTVTVTQNPLKITYEVPLAKDWNYFSVPIIPIDTDIEEVLYSIEGGYTEVWSYEGQQWQLYVPDKPDSYYTALGLDKITDIEDGIGYIIRMIDPDILTCEGYELEPGAVLPPTYELLLGWNLSGFKTMDFNSDGVITQADDTMRVGYYLSNLDADYDTNIIGQEARFLRWYNPGEGWKELAQADNMWVGKGNWLYASETGLIIVPPIVAE